MIPHQAGCGGTAPSRTSDPKAESVKRINTSFPHWFCGNFKKFNEHTDRLPFDQHCLVALCARGRCCFPTPRKTSGPIPTASSSCCERRRPVYELYGEEGLADDAKPEIGTLTKSRLGYFLRDGKHSMIRPDWEVFLEFADEHLKGKK